MFCQLHALGLCASECVCVKKLVQNQGRQKQCEHGSGWQADTDKLAIRYT